MKVSELIQKLEDFRNEHGDLEVFVMSYNTEMQELCEVKKDEMVYGVSNSVHEGDNFCLLSPHGIS